DQNGKVLTDDLKISFTTENIGANITVGSFFALTQYQLPGDFSPIFGGPPTIFASDVLQLAFFSDIDFASFTFTLTGPNGPVKTVETYADSPKDPESMTCPVDQLSTSQIDLAY